MRASHPRRRSPSRHRPRRRHRHRPPPRIGIALSVSVCVPERIPHHKPLPDALRVAHAAAHAVALPHSDAVADLARDGLADLRDDARPHETFYGRGWGHGVGLTSTAPRAGRRRPDAGADPRRVLQGRQPTTVTATQNIRVLVLASYNAVKPAPLVIYGRETEGRSTAPPPRSPPAASSSSTARRRPSTASRRHVAAPGPRRTRRPAHLFNMNSGRVRHRAAARPPDPDSGAFLQLDSKPPTTYDTFRGRLRSCPGTGRACGWSTA